MNDVLRAYIRLFALIGLTTAVLLLSTASLAAEKPAVKESFGLDGIAWQTQATFKSANLVVTGPGGFRWRQTFAPGDALFLDFESLTGAYSPSGHYKYELVFTPRVTAADRALARDARELGEEVDFLAHKAIPAVSGGFAIDGGQVVDRDLTEPDLLKFVHSSDVSIIGSLCVGFDCPSSPSFGFDTVRLQENNLRVHFNDTSSTASFPDNDWRITINDSSNGGAEYFSIDDASASRQVFKLEAGAPSNSMYVDDGGRLGLGTSSPVVDVHVVSGNTPTLRLEQNGSSGFTPQTWDVAGNEANFFIRDVTGGSALPFRIQPGTASNTLYLANDEQVGIGTTSPDGKLDIDNGTSDATLVLSQTGTVDAQWEIKNNEATGRLTFGTIAGGGAQVPFKFGPDAVNNLLRVGTQANDQVDIAGNLVITGDCTEQNGACADYVFEPGYERLSLQELREFITVNQHLPNVPSTDQIQQSGVNMTHFTGRLLEKIEELVLYTLDQQETIDEMAQTRVALEARIARLESKR